jgi:hypothetical protein
MQLQAHPVSLSLCVSLFLAPYLSLAHTSFFTFLWLSYRCAFPDWRFQQGGCGCLGPIFGSVPPGAHWPQDKGLTSNEQILGFLDVRDVVSSFIVGECCVGVVVGGVGVGG